MYDLHETMCFDEILIGRLALT